MSLRRDQEEWLNARIRFRKSAEDILFLGLLYPKGTALPDRMEEKLYSNYQRHTDAAYDLLRETLSLWEVEEPFGMTGALPLDIQEGGDAAVNIQALTYALDRNEATLKDIHRAVGVLLLYVKHEREILQQRHYEQQLQLSE